MLADQDVQYALVVLIVATPFMFLTLTLFSLLAVVLSRVPTARNHDDQ